MASTSLPPTQKVSKAQTERTKNLDDNCVYQPFKTDRKVNENKNFYS